MRSFCSFSTKNISVFGYKVVKHLTSWPLNELVKLTMLWTTGPWFIETYPGGLELLTYWNLSSWSQPVRAFGVPLCIFKDVDMTPYLQNTWSNLENERVVSHQSIQYKQHFPDLKANRYQHLIATEVCWPLISIYFVSFACWKGHVGPHWERRLKWKGQNCFTLNLIYSSSYEGKKNDM